MALKEYQTTHVVNIRYLEAVAVVRLALMEIASLLQRQSVNVVTESEHQQQLKFKLVQLAESMCLDPTINSRDFDANAAGPTVYLLKLLVRRFGFQCLNTVSADHKWIVPKELQAADKV